MRQDLQKLQGKMADIKTSLDKTEGRLQQLEDFQGKVEKHQETINELEKNHFWKIIQDVIILK